MKTFLSLLAGALLALLPSDLTAEPAVIVTLAGVGDRVRAQNPDLAAARLRIREAMGRMAQSGRLSNPELEISFAPKTHFREGDLEVGLTQRFPVTDRLRLEKTISLAELHAAEAEVADVERQLIASAREVLVEVLATRERRALLHEQSKVSREFADFISAAAAKGEGSVLDAGQARLEATSLATELRQLDAAAAALLGRLKPLLGMQTGEAVHVSGTLPGALLPDGAVDPDNRPDYRAASLDAQAADTQVALEKARRHEDLTGNLFVGADRMEDAPEGLDTQAVIGFRLSVALPIWDRNEGAIAEAEARKDRKQLEAAALARGIRLEAEAARAEMIEWKRMIREIEDTLLPLANDQGKLAEEAYRSGQAEIQPLLQSRAKRLELAAARVDALREFHLARVRYEAALGQP